MQRSEVIKFLILRTIGNFLVLFSITGITLTFGQALYQEVLFRINTFRGVHYAVADVNSGQPTASGFIPSADLNAITIAPIDADFGIVIPKINANAHIIPNVDPADYKSYMAALSVGVAHAAGSVFPGMQGNVYLFAHSTDYFWNVGRYNAIFYLLKDVSVGDEVDIFYSGKRYVYTVYDTKIVSPDDVSYITDSQTGEERVTLQTCWPPGTTLKRLLVFAKPKAT